MCLAIPGKIVELDSQNALQAVVDVVGVRRTDARVGVAAYFGVREQRFVSLFVDRGHRKEEAVAGIETEFLGRDQLLLAGIGKRYALAIEVFAYGASGYHKVVDLASLGLLELDLYALHGVAVGGEVPR